jgi:hypothetical protein
MKTTYTKRELQNLDTIEQAWDGDELKIREEDFRLWLVIPENRAYNGDYIIEIYNEISCRWEMQSCYFSY